MDKHRNRICRNKRLSMNYDFIQRHKDRIERASFLIYPIALLITLVFKEHIQASRQIGISFMQQHIGIFTPMLILICLCILYGSSYTEKTYYYFIIGMLALCCIALAIAVFSILLLPISPAAPQHIAFFCLIVVSVIINAIKIPRKAV